MADCLGMTCQRVIGSPRPSAFMFHQVDVVRDHHDAVAADDADERDEAHPMGHGKLGAARPPWALHGGDGDDDNLSTRSAKLGRGNEHHWWLRHWIDFAEGGKNAEFNTLPRRKDDFTKLPEADHLKPLIFGDDRSGKRRLDVANEVAKASAADHMNVCEHLRRVFAGEPIFVLLPRFSRLADGSDFYRQGMDGVVLVFPYLPQTVQGSIDLMEYRRAKAQEANAASGPEEGFKRYVRPRRAPPADITRG